MIIAEKQAFHKSIGKDEEHVPQNDCRTPCIVSFVSFCTAVCPCSAGRIAGAGGAERRGGDFRSFRKGRFRTDTEGLYVGRFDGGRDRRATRDPHGQQRHLRRKSDLDAGHGQRRADDLRQRCDDRLFRKLRALVYQTVLYQNRGRGGRRYDFGRLCLSILHRPDEHCSSVEPAADQYSLLSGMYCIVGNNAARGADNDRLRCL